MKLWGGRFTKSTDESVDDFNSSIRFDKRLYKQDISGSIAHAKMLGKTGIIPEIAAEKIVKGLEGILCDIEAGNVEFQIDAEDIHMNVETILTSRIGDVGKMLHTGRSRNDQVALDIRMYLKDEIVALQKKISELLKVLLEIAENNLDTIMPGYTHMQRAQPITLAAHAMAYYHMFDRDMQRLSDCLVRCDIMPLGAGALAGTTYPLDREYVAELLGFHAITENSLDSVSDRDFIIEFLSDASIMMMHLSRYCEELVIWSSHEFSFVEMDDAFSTGSSIMPQKKNPDIAELVRGKTGRVYGDLMAMLSVMKSLPLAYNKDMQEDKESLFDAIDTCDICLSVFTKMLSTCKFKKERMHSCASKGFVNATDFADYIVKRGIPFRTCHEITGKLILKCLEQDKGIEEMSLDDMREVCKDVLGEGYDMNEIIEEDIYSEISLRSCVDNRKVAGGPSPDSVLKDIKLCRNR